MQRLGQEAGKYGLQYQDTTHYGTKGSCIGVPSRLVPRLYITLGLKGEQTGTSKVRYQLHFLRTKSANGIIKPYQALGKFWTDKLMWHIRIS